MHPFNIIFPIKIWNLMYFIFVEIKIKEIQTTHGLAKRIINESKFDKLEYFPIEYPPKSIKNIEISIEYPMYLWI